MIRRLGGDKKQIAENAARAVETFETARQQIEDLDQLSSARSPRRLSAFHTADSGSSY